MNKFIYRLFVVLATTSLIWACSDEDPWSPYQSKATISSNSKGWDENYNTIKTSGDVRFTWEATIVEGYDWCSFSMTDDVIVKTGKVGGSANIYFDKNETTVSRWATVFIKFSDGYTATLTFNQLDIYLLIMVNNWRGRIITSNNNCCKAQ